MTLKSFKLYGGLAVLLVSVAVGLLYLYCSFVSTRYETLATSNRADRERLLATRLSPRAPLPIESPHPTSSDGSTTGTQGLLWNKALKETAQWNPLIGWRALIRSFSEQQYSREPGYFFTARRLQPGDLVLDPASQSFHISPSLRSFVERIGNPYEEYLKDRIRHVKEPDRQPSSRNQTSGTTETAAILDRMENLLSEERWDRVNFFDLAHLKDWPDARKILLSEKSCQAIYRTLRRGDSKKAAQLTERYVRLSGEKMFSEQGTCFFSQGDQMLELFLFSLAAERQAPEDTLEWIASTLASWELDSQEYETLRIANINLARDLLVSSFKASFLLRDTPWWQGRDWNRISLQIVEQTGTRIAEPLLVQAIDRAAVALIERDAAAYELAHQQIKTAIRTIHFAQKGAVDYSPAGFYSRSYLDLLLRNGRESDSDGVSLVHSGKTLPPGIVPDVCPVKPEDLFSVVSSGRSPDNPSLTQQEQYNREIARLRLAFAAARYHREHGRYPESVRDMIPRYLDESFTTHPGWDWIILTLKPFDRIVLPESDLDPPSRFTRLLAAYRDDSRNNEKWPIGIADLKPYAQPGEDLTPFSRCFVHLDEMPVFGLVIRNERLPVWKTIDSSGNLSSSPPSFQTKVEGFLFYETWDVLYLRVPFATWGFEEETGTSGGPPEKTRPLS